MIVLGLWWVLAVSPLKTIATRRAQSYHTGAAAARGNLGADGAAPHRTSWSHQDYMGTDTIGTRLGKAEGLAATAHKDARNIFGMIASSKACDETEAFKQTPSSITKRLHCLMQQAKNPGYQLVPAA